MNFFDDSKRVKTGLAEMLKGGVIMDVTTAAQACIAEAAGACAVMAIVEKRVSQNSGIRLLGHLI